MMPRVPALKRLREAAPYSQRELAERIGVTATTIFKAEHGNDVRASTVRKLAAALGVTPAELMSEQQP